MAGVLCLWQLCFLSTPTYDEDPPYRITSGYYVARVVGSKLDADGVQGRSQFGVQDGKLNFVGTLDSTAHKKSSDLCTTMNCGVRRCKIFPIVCS
ncbi:hypothetical protein BGZ57DRAFT_910205 [Hyaloscypha finlandica]|nr:hypothetical protein BGZ57DRAFT_910205 [Hyaloscypha finlandica]